MNFHEFQAKQLFGDYGIAVPAGRVARTPEEAVDAAKAIGGDFWVVKAQIHAGGRGKAGGVKLAKTIDEVEAHAKSCSAGVWSRTSPAAKACRSTKSMSKPDRASRASST
jgi:succinyl-CoA synthetase beta subunit